MIASTRELLLSLHQRLDDAIKTEDPAALQALADDIQANTDALSAAVQENTPATGGAPSSTEGQPTP